MKCVMFIFMVCVVCVGSLFAVSAVDMQARFDSGMQAMKSGNYPKAVCDFLEMLSKNPDLPRVRLELARAYSLMGRRMSAALEFKKVLRSNSPDRVRENVERYLDSIGGVPKWTFNGSIAYMFDDNVTAGTDSDVVHFYGLPFKLDDSAKKQADSAMLFNVGMNYVVPISDSASWVSRFSFDSTSYFYWSKFDFQMLRGSTGPVWREGKTTWRFPAVWDYAYFGSKKYAGGLGVRPGFSTFLSDDLILNGSVLLERKRHYFRSDRSGYLTGFDLSVRKILSSDFFVDAGYQFWREDTKSSFLSNDTDVVYGALSKKLADDLTLRGSVALSWSEYDKGSPAFGGNAREDFRKRVSVSLSKRLAKDKELFVEYARTENGSNHDLYTYDRNQVMMGLRLMF